MTTPDLKAIAGRTEKATAGPWTIERPANDGMMFAPGVLIAATGRNQGIFANPLGGQFPASDRIFIAHARTDIPDLLALVHSLKADNERLREALKNLEAYTTQLIDSGDCGNWDSGGTAEIVAARTALQPQTKDMGE